MNDVIEEPRPTVYVYPVYIQEDVLCSHTVLFGFYPNMVLYPAMGSKPCSTPSYEDVSVVCRCESPSDCGVHSNPGTT